MRLILEALGSISKFALREMSGGDFWCRVFLILTSSSESKYCVCFFIREAVLGKKGLTPFAHLFYCSKRCLLQSVSSFIQHIASQQIVCFQISLFIRRKWGLTGAAVHWWKFSCRVVDSRRNSAGAKNETVFFLS